MVSQNGYSATLKCSEVNRKLILKNIKSMYKNKYPELEGINITQNMLITFMLKEVLGKDYDILKNDYQ